MAPLPFSKCLAGAESCTLPIAPDLLIIAVPILLCECRTWPKRRSISLDHYSPLDFRFEISLRVCVVFFEALSGGFPMPAPLSRDDPERYAVRREVPDALSF